ncbi:hypothetical protein N7532_002202 [Penicillium argentinense]|uniref:Uncharacterized protein n=1 Tax=Penicillium argentinense TaxID=1131581 RepID=A0A9W9G017_9EURO|nr:uncharacterized protein N7532_002202 [Penicillium argentinense]KAJ5109557.1 hypothetical protein N7532_002202 [Penicillium argentinense]
MVGRYPDYYHVLNQNRDQSLGYREAHNVTIDCRYLSSSRWGMLGNTPAWILLAELQISQPNDIEVQEAKLELRFRGTTKLNTSCLDVTKHYGPVIGFGRPVYKDVQKRAKAAPEGGGGGMSAKLGEFERATSQTYMYRWQVHGERIPDDEDRLYRRIAWRIAEAKITEQIDHRAIWNLGLALKHGGEPFLINTSISIQFRGWQKIFSTQTKDDLEPTQVTPPRKFPKDRLDDIVHALNDELTIENLKRPPEESDASAIRQGVPSGEYRDQLAGACEKLSTVLANV